MSSNRKNLCSRPNANAMQILLANTDKKKPADEAKGPTWGRYYADQLYENEYFALQIDAHMTFINKWDSIVVKQWKKLNNEMAVLTTYPSEVKKSVNIEGDSVVKTAPIICNTKLMKNGMFKHD
eukprot:UN28291